MSVNQEFHHRHQRDVPSDHCHVVRGQPGYPPRRITSMTFDIALVVLFTLLVVVSALCRVASRLGPRPTDSLAEEATRSRELAHSQ